MAASHPEMLLHLFGTASEAMSRLPHDISLSMEHLDLTSDLVQSLRMSWAFGALLGSLCILPATR